MRLTACRIYPSPAERHHLQTFPAIATHARSSIFNASTIQSQYCKTSSAERDATALNTKGHSNSQEVLKSSKICIGYGRRRYTANMIILSRKQQACISVPGFYTGLAAGGSAGKGRLGGGPGAEGVVPRDIGLRETGCCRDAEGARCPRPWPSTLSP